MTKWVSVIVVAAVGFGSSSAFGGSNQQLLVSSFFSDQVGRYDPSSGAFLGTLVGPPDVDGVLAARIGPDGLLYVASELSNEIIRYRVETGEFVDTFITGGGPVPLDGPSGFSWSPSGDLYVASFNSDSVLRFNGVTGAFLEEVISSGGLLNGPDNGIVFGPDGQLYIPSYFNNRIVRYDPATGMSKTLIQGVFRPRVIVFHENQMYITSETTRSVRRYTTDGAPVDVFIQEAASVIGQPVGLERYEGSWLVSSASLDRVLQFDDNGDLMNADFIPAGLGGMDAPTFLTLVTVPEPHSALALLIALVVLRPCRRSLSN